MPNNKNKVTHNKLDKLERSLKKKLLAFYNSKIKGSPIPTDILRQQHDQQVKDIIRKAAQESYIVGTDQVANQVLSKDESFQLFISGTDLNNIQGLTERLSNDFWNTARRLQDREATVTDQGVKKVPFNAVAALTGIAAGLIFSAFNNAIKSKSTQVTQPIVSPETFANANLSLELDIPFNFEVRPVGRVRFTTQHDSKVDPDICAPLDGTEWFVDDPSIITPPDQTHPNCRCTLEPILE